MEDELNVLCKPKSVWLLWTTHYERKGSGGEGKGDRYDGERIEGCQPLCFFPVPRPTSLRRSNFFRVIARWREWDVGCASIW